MEAWKVAAVALAGARRHVESRAVYDQRTMNNRERDLWGGPPGPPHKAFLRALVSLFFFASMASAQMIYHDYAEVNGVRLHYAATGKGKLILFLHGFPEFWYEWKDQLAEFG